MYACMYVYVWFISMRMYAHAHTVASIVFFSESKQERSESAAASFDTCRDRAVEAALTRREEAAQRFLVFCRVLKTQELKSEICMLYTF